MKHKFLFLAVLLSTLFTTSLWAQTPGYAIFGDKPYGYTDLTGSVNIVGAGSYSDKFVVEDGVLKITGNTSLSTTRVCSDENNNIRLQFGSAQTLTLTSNLAIHIKVKKGSTNSNANLHFALCRDGWNSKRLGYFIPQSGISDSEETEIVLKYGDHATFDWSSANETQMYGTNISFSANDIVRFQAQTNDYFEISQIYIDADATVPDPVEPASGDEDAPESLNLNYSNVTDKSVTLTATATDDNSPINYTFYYKADGDADFTAVAGTVNAASGADAVKVVTGLTPETNYSFKVVATDPSSNAAETTISGIETLAAFKNRFYFFRAGEIPEIEGVNMVDLRESVGTTFELNNMVKTSNVDYIHYALNGSWFSFNQNLSASTDMAIVEQSTWYLCIKMRTNLAQTSYNLRLNNAGECWMISSSNLPLACDGSWETLALPLSTSSKTLNFTAAMTGTIFQMHANGSAASDYIDIAYAYLTDDPLMDEKPAVVDITAPVNFSVAEKAASTTHNTTVLQLYAEDEDTPITYTISYKVKGSSDTPIETSVNGTQSITVEKEITGLAPETTYTFSVIASDPNGNETSPQVIEITTTEFTEKRYYFFRGAPASVNMPSAIACVDLRNGIGSTVAPQNSMTLTEYKYYSHFAKSGDWWSFNQNLSSATNMSEITQAEWYLVVKFRTNFTDGSFNIRLLNTGECYQVSQSNLSFDADGSWNTLTLALADAKKTLNFSASQTGTVFQFHANNGEGSYLDIAYAYLTNSASSADDLADATIPVISALSDGDKTTSSVVLHVSASDDSGEALTYIVKESETVLSSTPASGASGEETAITVSGLDGVNHTLTVIAQDGAGNQASQNIVVTLPAANEPPYNLYVSTIPAAHSIEFTMYAEDDNSALVYAILDGEMNILVDDIAGTAGSNTVYVLKGLAPETDYTFYVRVTDNADASVTSGVINETTTVLVEHRFYLMRGDNSEPLPSSATLASTMVDCNIEYGNVVARDARAEYFSVKTNANWMSVSLKPTATVANEINDDWYIVVRMRSALSTSFDFDRFRLNLVNNGQNWYINNSDADKQFGHDYNDNNWIVMTKRIGDRRAGTAIPASYLQAGQIAAQLHVDNQLVAGEYLDIDYIYFTDDITAIDEGTMSGKKIMIKENADNASLLDANDGLTVEVDLTRSLTNVCYNTFCVPFDLSAEQVEAVFGAGTTIGKLGNAHMKDGDELYLGFEFVDAIEAGVPYIIQPANEVANPLIANVTINKEPNNTVIDGVIAFKGVTSPEQIEAQSAESHSILLLGANNVLSWPNTTANIKGMRAYFETTSTVAHVARRAHFGFESEQTATEIDQVSGLQAPVNDKVIIDGQLFIIREGVKYNALGQKVK